MTPTLFITENNNWQKKKRKKERRKKTSLEGAWGTNKKKGIYMTSLENAPNCRRETLFSVLDNLPLYIFRYKMVTTLTHTDIDDDIPVLV